MTSAPEASVSLLTMQAGAHVVGVPAAQVRETMRPLPLEPLTGAPPYVLGLAVIRGKATPVIDVAALLSGEPAAPPLHAGRFVTLRVAVRAIALSVDAIIALQAPGRAAFEALPPLWRGSRPPAVAELATVDRELLLVLETARLLPDAWAGAHAGGER
jgi:purine-binding chemotaxis protein CheW